MKRKFKINALILFVIGLTTVVSCNQKQAKEENAQNTQLDKLKKELADVKVEINKLATDETKDFKSDAKRLINDFENSINDFENQMTKAGEEIDEDTRQAISVLKSEANELNQKVDQLTDESKENWKEMKEEIKHDFSKFGESIGNFFKDNA